MSSTPTDIALALARYFGVETVTEEFVRDARGRVLYDEDDNALTTHIVRPPRLIAEHTAATTFIAHDGHRSIRILNYAQIAEALTQMYPVLLNEHVVARDVSPRQQPSSSSSSSSEIDSPKGSQDDNSLHVMTRLRNDAICTKCSQEWPCSVAVARGQVQAGEEAMIDVHDNDE